MPVEFVLDEKGAPQKDAVTGHYLVKRNGENTPLDLDKLFQGITDSNRDAQAKRQALEKMTADLTAVRAELETLKAENESLRKSGDSKDKSQETETERRIRALEDSLAKEREEKKRIQEEQERREADRQIEIAFSESGYASEHGHIPLDFWLARYGSCCGFEDVNGVRCLVVKDASGNVVMSEKYPGNPAKLDEGLAVLCAGRPKPGDVKLNSAPYGGAGTRQPQRTGMGSNPWKQGQVNITQQHKIMAEDPALAHRLAAEAGIQLPAI